MQSIRIEKNIPVPANSRRGRKPVFPFKDMNPGDSFFVPCASRDEQTSIAQRIRGSASHRVKRKGERYAVHVVEGGVRAWLISREEPKHE